MATTSGILTAGKAPTGQGGKSASGGRPDLKISLVAVVAIVGLAAAVLLGGFWVVKAAQRQPQSPPSAVQLPAGTDDLATNVCVGTVGPFACPVSQPLVGADDLATNVCVGTVGPFACPTNEDSPSRQIPQRTGPADEYER